MKLILFVVATILSISAYSQAFMQPRNMKDCDERNNAPLKKPSILSNEPFANSVDITGYSYDTVRELIEINNPGQADAHPWISSDGLRLYYTSGFNNDQMAMAERTDINSYFGTPVIIPIPYNWGISYWLSPDELELYFSDSYYIWYTNRDAINLPFSLPERLNLQGIPGPDYISAQSLNTEQNKMFLHIYDNGVHRILQYSNIVGWPYFDYEKTLSAPPGFSMIGGQLSKDDLTYFVSAQYNDGPPMLYQMTRITPSDTFDINTFELIRGINDTTVFGNAFPTMSDNLEWVAFNRADNNNWEQLDLFLAHDGILTSAFDPVNLPILSFAYPNPASEFVIIKYKSLPGYRSTLIVYSPEGEIVYKNDLNPSEGIIKVNTNQWVTGVYCYRISQFEGKTNRYASGKFIVQH